MARVVELAHREGVVAPSAVDRRRAPEDESGSLQHFGWTDLV